MHLKSPLIGLLIVCLAIELPSPTAAQFWLKLPEQNWEREMLATRDSGVCYKEEIVETINPNARLRQISYCCEGYVNHGSPQNLRCQPICTEDCANGLCLSPGYCECAPGYYREERRCKRM